MIEIVKALTPALSALVGGLLAILSGLLVQRKNQAENSRDFLREKIEEIYQHTIDTEEWLQQETIKISTYIENGSKINLDKLKSKSSHIRMLLKLYFDNSLKVCGELDEFETIFFNGMYLAYTAPAEFNKPEHQKSIHEASKLYFFALVKIREFLQSEMKKLTKVDKWNFPDLVFVSKNN